MSQVEDKGVGDTEAVRDEGVAGDRVKAVDQEGSPLA